MAKRVGKVFLTYESEEVPDGAGAQLQRIAGLYGLAKHIRIGYLHTGLADISWNPGDGINSKSERLQALTELNDAFALQSSERRKGVLKEVHLKSFGLKSLVLVLYYKLTARSQGVLFKAKTPYPLADWMPQTYQAAGSIWSSRYLGRTDTPAQKRGTVTMHIRRAVNPPSDANGKANPRYVSPSWYEAVFRGVVREMRPLPVSLEIHTDLGTDKSIAIPESSLRESTKYWETLGIRQSDSHIEPAQDTFEGFLSDFKNRKTIIDLPPLEAMYRMASSEVFIGAKSSMSFVVGLLRGGKVTVFPKFWHTNPRNWISLGSTFRNEQFQKPFRRRISKAEH